LSREDDLAGVLKDILDAFWDMSPLEYVQSRGHPCMSDKIGEEVLNRARELVKGSKTTDAVKILHNRYIGDDEERKKSLEKERVINKIAVELDHIRMDGMCIPRDAKSRRREEDLCLLLVSYS